MKTTPSIILNVVLAAALAVTCVQLAHTGRHGGGAPGEVPSAQGQFKEFDPSKEFSANPFTFFMGDGHGLLLAAGDRERSNAMTIGWGSLGGVWGDSTSTITVFVAQQRLTHVMMENSKYFTVMRFDAAHDGVLDYMGHHSGRDGDKAAALGLHTLYTEHGAPYYAEASEVYECETIYHTQLDSAAFGDLPRNFYKGYTAGIHSVYVGRIVKALKKQ